ncbi:MAG: PASTA domain-containing protein [Gemmatimonadota bacterium]|nr:PASTA domain-containing protein [Gemmatimonadota bacterium]
MNLPVFARRAIPFLVIGIGGFLVAYVIVVLFVFPSRLVSNDNKIPNVMGIRYDDAERRLTNAGFAPAKGESRYHATAAPGQVLGQNPVPGSVMPKGARVVLDVSLGQRQAPIPRVVGMTRAEAGQALEAAGLEVGEVLEEASGHSRGQVLATQPVAGVRVPIGSTVDLMVSRGPSSVEVPDVVGQSYPDARNRITQLGLAVGKISIDSGSALQPNSVVTQNPASGRTVSPGTPVNLTIAGRAVP